MLVPYGQIHGLVRDLAKTNYYQTLYSGAKELGFKFFENDRDFTEIQIIFLNYLGFYQSLNIDIATGEVDQIVKTDTVYEDAWFFYKQNGKKELDKFREQSKIRQPNDIETDKYKKTTTKFVFRRRK